MIHERLNQIEVRAQAATLAQAETSLSMDGFDMHEDYPEYGQGQLMNAYMLGYDEGCAEKPALVAAVRAVLDVCEGLEEAHRANPDQSYEYGMEEAAHQVRNAITAALGEEA